MVWVAHGSRPWHILSLSRRSGQVDLLADLDVVGVEAGIGFLDLLDRRGVTVAGAGDLEERIALLDRIRRAGDGRRRTGNGDRRGIGDHWLNWLHRLNWLDRLNHSGGGGGGGGR